MKKLTALLLSVLLVFLTACSEEDHTGQAKTPSGSSAMEGSHYEDVVRTFKENGFTNIKTEKLEDLITGWLTEDGEVEEVSVGGDTGYAPDKWVDADTEVIITYHTFPADDSTEPESEPEYEPESEPEAEPQNLTVENCPELKEILSLTSETDDRYSAFSNKYLGRTIEFDGRVDYCAPHGDYSTRYDFLVSAGDYDPDHQIGPYFKFEDVNYFDLNTDLDEVGVGMNVHIVAKVGSFNMDTSIFELDPVSVTGR